MGMPEFEDGSLGEIKQYPNFKEIQDAAQEESIKLMHFSKDLKALEEKKLKPVGEGETNFLDQLERIESMLSAIIVHLGVPYQGILRVYKNTQ